MRHTLCSPFEQAHRVALGFKKAFQIIKQARVLLHCLFPSPTLLALSISWAVAFPRFQFSQATPDRVVRDACLLGDLHHTSSLLSFQRKEVSPLFLIEHFAHRLVFLCSTTLYHAC